MDTKSRQVYVQELLDSNPLSAVQYAVLILSFLIMLLDGYDTAVVAFVAPVLSKTWHVTPPELRPVLSAALFGVAFGSLVAGPLADRFGRKLVLIGSVLFFGACTLLSAFADGLGTLTLLRLLTGLGLGAAMPNAVTLTSEFAPTRFRALMVGFLFCGFTLGSAGGGLLGGFLIPALGWQSAFIVGGVVPVILALAMLALPESIAYLGLRSATARLRQLLGRIERRKQLPQDAEFIFPSQGGKANQSLRVLFQPGLAAGTICLWITYFLGLLVIFLLRSWLPTLVTMSGESIQRASFLSASFDIGGTFGALIVARCIDWFRSDKPIPISYFLAAIVVALFAPLLGHTALLAIGIFVAGFLLSGPQASMPAVAAKFYPTSGRATGVAWVLGIGRFGGIAGALMGGTLLGFGWSFQSILTALAIPTVLAALVVWFHVRREAA